MTVGGHRSGPAIYYGLCVGGPWTRSHMAHATPEYRVAIDATARPGSRAIPGMQASKSPDISFGLYRYDESAGAWLWEPPSAAPKRVDNKTS